MEQQKRTQDEIERPVQDLTEDQAETVQGGLGLDVAAAGPHIKKAVLFVRKAGGSGQD